MAAVGPTQFQILYNQGGTDLIALFAIRNVQTGDTFDVAQSGIAPPFAFVRYAVIMSFTGGKASLATITGTVVTMPTGLPANSSVYLFIGGC